MAQPAGTFATNDMIGRREDLSDTIYKISPIETPFLSMVAHTEATQINHEWQTVSLTTAANNKAIEGDDAPNNAGVATVRLGNLTQISTKDARVSGTGRAVNTAGRADELSYQMLLKGQELKRDMEVGLLSNKAKVAGNDTLARELAGIVSWLKTNESTTGTAPSAADGTATRTDGTQRAFTEDLLKVVLAKCADEGGFPDILMVGSFNRQKVSGFTGGSTSVQKAEDKTLHATFSVYESDFGNLKVVYNRFQRTRDALVLQSDKWAVPFISGRNMVAFDIAKTGDSDAKQILSEYTLESRNEKASGIVADLTTS
jgi:hypothetical protein